MTIKYGQLLGSFEMYKALTVDAPFARVPLGCFGDPATDVSPVVAFLLSDDLPGVCDQKMLIPAAYLALFWAKRL